MRVIAGVYRSRLLSAPKGMEVRPTSDRLRETVFNVLAARWNALTQRRNALAAQTATVAAGSAEFGPGERVIAAVDEPVGTLRGCRFVDLYAGSGAVGIEALSRGAVDVWMAESSPAAITGIRKNLTALGIKRGVSVEERGVGALLQRLDKQVGAGLVKPVDVVYLDPPYEAENEYEATLSFLGSKRGLGVLAPGAVVLAEHRKQHDLAERYGGLKLLRELRQGDAKVSVYGVPDEPAEAIAAES